MPEFDANKFFEQAKISTKVRPDRFDSEAERSVATGLYLIMRDYGLDKILNLRLIPQQAIDNYVDIKEDFFSDAQYERFLKNRTKWMKFDFIFEKEYYYNNEIHYEPVAVVEFDGPHHFESEYQRELDFFKNGIAVKIGADIVRIDYRDHEGRLNADSIRNGEAGRIIKAIIKGYFTKSVNYRKEGKLINEINMKQFQYIVNRYTDAEKAEESVEKKKNYNFMLQTLYHMKENEYVSPT